MEKEKYVIKSRKTSHEELIVKRFPYTLLIRCWSLIRKAEEDFFNFHQDYMEYASNAVNCTIDHVVFQGIPITDDGNYYLDLYIEDGLAVGFSIINKPQ